MPIYDRGVDVDPEWLSLIEYRNKYGVSVSTLRRRIRDNAIKFQLLRGKYFVYDEPVEPKTDHQTYIEATIKEHFVEEEPVETGPSADVRSLLGEIKEAYQTVLKEKEEHIFLLKEEIINQQMLIKILEEENQRIRASR